MPGADLDDAEANVSGSEVDSRDSSLKTAPRFVDTDIATALFVDDRELRRRINPKFGWERFRAAVRDAELRQGFPKVSRVWQGRYWPAVKQWLDKEYGIDPAGWGAMGEVEDGPETFDAAPTRRRQTPRR